MLLDGDLPTDMRFCFALAQFDTMYVLVGHLRVNKRRQSIYAPGIKHADSVGLTLYASMRAHS